jgi:acetylornithine deacetylase/succinyl-diaminopimelate desuccinylase-like protein
VTVSWDHAHAIAKSALGLAEWPLAAPAHDASASKLDVTLMSDVIRESGVALNVLGRVRGADRSRCVVVGAHYDHLGFGGTGSLAPHAKREIHNGADDNASGTAAVIEIARAVKSAGTPPCDMVFALWSGEELGLLGSEHWATHPTLPWGNVRANLNLDMVGRAGNGKLQVLGAGTSSVFAAWMEEAARKSGLDLTVSISGQALGGSSDHQTFLKRKLPALHLFSGLHADYHKPSDDTERFEAAGTARVVALGVDLALRMASTPELDFVVPPAPKEGDKVTTGGFKVRLGTIPNYAYDGKGVLIDGASQGTPAERAGLLRGDVLVKLGDVALENVYDLTYALGRFKPGDVVVLHYLRDGKPQETRVTLVAPAGEVR